MSAFKKFAWTLAIVIVLSFPFVWIIVSRRMGLSPGFALLVPGFLALLTLGVWLLSYLGQRFSTPLHGHLRKFGYFDPPGSPFFDEVEFTELCSKLRAVLALELNDYKPRDRKCAEEIIAKADVFLQSGSSEDARNYVTALYVALWPMSLCWRCSNGP